MQSSADPESRIASGRKSARWRRSVRKHRLALVLWGVVVALLVIPTLFSGRVLSPNDVYYGHDPWRSLREIEARNPLMSDPPSSWMPLWSLLRTSPDSFHWNPWVGGGIPGWGSAASAVLSPVVLLPVLLVPFLFSYLAIVLTKLTVGFVLAYGWLREERLGRNGAALGALLFSACGIYSVWWLWQATNATVFYPAVFWILRRAWTGRTTPVLLQVGLALALALSGFPATTIYVGWAGLAYAAWLTASRRKLPVRELAKGALAVALAALLAAPFLAPFASFIQRTGYLEGRETVAEAAAGRYPAEHLLAFFDPYRLGDAGRGLWTGDAALGLSNNFNESTIYLGFIALPLAAIGAFARRRRDRWFWIAFLSFLLLLLFARWDSLANAIGSLPGVRYSPLARLRFLLPLPAAWLAAAGAGILFRRRARLQLLAVGVLGAWLVLDLGTFAVRYFPFPSFEVARLPQSPAISRLQQEKAPFRIAPMFDFLWPNSSQLVRLEDVRSHFGSEERWRRLLNRFASGSFGSTGTVVLFNSLNFDFDDPLVSFLNIRWFAEQPSIDILRWRIAERSTLSEPLVGSYRLMPDQELRQTVEIDGSLSAIDLNFDAPIARERGAAIELALIRPETGKSVWTRRIAFDDLERLPKVYVPTRPWGEEGNALVLSIRARGMAASVPRGASGIAYGRVRSPIILHSVDRDGRLFENLAAQNRYFAVWDVESMSFEEFLAAPDLDLSRVAALTGGASTEPAGAIESVPPPMRRVSMRTRWAPDRAVIETESRAPFLLATSEKITPELEIRVDGERREPIEINGLFAAVPMDAGAHTVVLERRIGRGLWLPAAGAAAGVFVLALVGWIGRGSRRRTLSPAARPRR